MRDREMFSWKKHLPCKYKGLDLIPRNYSKIWLNKQSVVAKICHLISGQTQRQINPGTQWPSYIAYLTVSRIKTKNYASIWHLASSMSMPFPMCKHTHVAHASLHTTIANTRTRQIYWWQISFIFDYMAQVFIL